jgi:BNR repeat-like domain
MRARSSSLCRFSTVLSFVCLTMLVLTTSAAANVPLTQMAVDPFTNSSSQHSTIVGPDTFSFGSTIVAAAQLGRFSNDGASDVGFATSTNNGITWTSGVLPGITGFTSPAGPYARVSDPSVAYDAKHNVWLISTLALQPIPGGTSGRAILTSRSTNGGFTWGNPVTTAVALPIQDFDKNWIVCDNTPTSLYYGSCYTQWDDYAAGNRLKVAYSQDGGLTWTPSNVPPFGAVGGQPLVLPNGRVVVVFSNVSQTALRATISTNGGVSFAGVFPISTIAAADDPGAIRSDPLSSAEISGDGRIYVVWADCRYRAGCPNPGSTNDLVYKTSTNGMTWNPPWPSSPNRIPIDPIFSTVDHFIPGVAVDRLTSGASIHVAVAFYFYPNVSCTAATCQLSVGYVSSANGGSTWSVPIQLAGPMATSWLPNTTQGRMVGDYISTSFDSIGLAHPVFALANASTPTGDCAIDTPFCDQALYTPMSGLPVGGPIPTPPPAAPFSGGSPGANPQKR